MTLVRKYIYLYIIYINRLINKISIVYFRQPGVSVGTAIVDSRYANKGASVGIFVLPEIPLEEKQKPDLRLGNGVLLHVDATIFSRFPAIP